MIQTIDFYILDAIQNLRCGFLDYIMPKITFLGSGGLVWIIITLIYLIRRDTRRTGIMLASVLILGLIIGNGMLKNIIARERPNGLNPSVQLLIGNPTDFSFPSGHTLASFEGAVSLILYHKKSGIAAVVLAALIAFSRLYLMVHYPLDVITGVILGTAFAIIASKLSDILIKKVLIPVI